VAEAAAHFHALPSCTVVEVPADGRVTVVGDTHGQLPDLLHILAHQARHAEYLSRAEMEIHSCAESSQRF
jgi:hypothetical protein